MIKHHLTDSLLMAYSAGTLPEAFNLIVSAHVSLCDQCRAALESYDAIGGALLAEAGDDQYEPMAPGSLEATLKLIASADAEPVVPQSRPVGPVPGPLMDYIGADLDGIEWKPVGMGVKQAVLATSAEASARMLYIPAGTAMPDHGHNGTELTMVLQGAFIDGDERFGRGDIEIADEDLDHTPVADIGEDCICLAVTDAPLRFNSLLPRLAQPFLRI